MKPKNSQFSQRNEEQLLAIHLTSTDFDYVQELKSQCFYEFAMDSNDTLLLY